MTLVDLAQRLVRAPGHNPPGEEAATVAVLADECRRRGWDVTLDDVAPGRPNLVAHLPGGPGPGLLFLGHSDVVPPGDGWTVDPYSGAVEDGYLYGRGSADMLGAVAALVHAMDALRDVPLSGPVTLAVLVDEEELGLGARTYVEQLSADDYRACLVAEPTDLQPIVAARGDAYVEIAITGLAAHSGNPDDGRNAIQAMAGVVAEIERWHHDLATRPHPLVGPATWSVGTIEGGQATTTVPAHCRISADRRLLPGESADDVLKAVDQAVDALGLSERGFGFEVAMTMDMPGFETPIDDPFVAQVGDARRAAGLPPSTPGGWTAACDGGFIAERTGMPVVVLGPGSVTEAAHRPDERVRIADLEVAMRTYTALARDVLVSTSTTDVGRACRDQHPDSRETL